MADVRQLRYDDIALGRPFHAARVTLEPGPYQPHTHDFAEMFYVIGGAGTHQINDTPVPLSPGALVLIRPPDRHSYRPAPGGTLRFINIAFPTEAWREFLGVAQISDAARWEVGALPPTVAVPERGQAVCAAAFMETLAAFHDRPTRLSLCRFLAQALTWLLAPESTPNAAAPEVPPWLRAAQEQMSEEENLRAGFPRLVALSGVSPAHLARTLKRHTGQTPTEWVNGLRLRQAARLLATTDQPILDLALDCGFENLSYFYRLFRQAYGLAPHAYRVHARRAVAP